MCPSYKQRLQKSLQFFIFLLASGSFSPRSPEEPWSVSREHPVTREVEKFSRAPGSRSIKLFSEYFFDFYATYISPIDGQSCHYLPTCSAYGAQAIKQYGVFWGFLMTADRLLRCHPGQSEHPVDPPVRYW